MDTDNRQLTRDDLVILYLPDCGGMIDAETVFLRMKAAGVSIGSVYLKIE